MKKRLRLKSWVKDLMIITVNDNYIYIFSSFIM